jgi:hypothetical protein
MRSKVVTSVHGSVGPCQEILRKGSPVEAGAVYPFSEMRSPLMIATNDSIGEALD